MIALALVVVGLGAFLVGRATAPSAGPVTTPTSTATLPPTSAPAAVEVVIPRSIVRESEKAAEVQLRSDGFMVRAVVHWASDIIPSGVVMDTVPAPGSLVPRGTAVYLVVSSGPKRP